MLRIWPQLLAELSMFRPLLPLVVVDFLSRVSVLNRPKRLDILYLFSSLRRRVQMAVGYSGGGKGTRKELHYNIERRRVGLDISLNILSGFCDPTRPCGV